MMDEVSNSNLSAKDLICLHLKEKKEKLENELIKKQHVIELKKIYGQHILLMIQRLLSKSLKRELMM